MNRTVTVIASVVIALHGVIHLMGAAAYLKLSVVQGLPYKTTVLGGRWNLGETGMAVFGVLWAVAALGFVVCALALFNRQAWFRFVLVDATLLSLVLTVLDFDVAFAGVVVNLVILTTLWLESRGLTSTRPSRG
jgi:hypothetical protein